MHAHDTGAEERGLVEDRAVDELTTASRSAMSDAICFASAMSARTKRNRSRVAGSRSRPARLAVLPA
jgi:hypothetical protein